MPTYTHVGGPPIHPDGKQVSQGDTVTLEKRIAEPFLHAGVLVEKAVESVEQRLRPAAEPTPASEPAEGANQQETDK